MAYMPMKDGEERASLWGFLGYKLHMASEDNSNWARPAPHNVWILTVRDCPQDNVLSTK